MKPPVFVRVAAVLTLLLGVGHLLGKPWLPAKDPLTIAVKAAMESHHIHVMGFDRTVMDFYVGFGVTIGINLLMQAFLLWITADLARRDPARARAMTLVFFIANAAVTVISGVYLFLLPVLFAAIVTLFLGIAALQSWQGATARG
jgi:hypothetical protein